MFYLDSDYSFPIGSESGLTLTFFDKNSSVAKSLHISYTFSDSSDSESS